MRPATPAMSAARLLALLLATVLAVATAFATTAEAAFPGTNGRLAFERLGNIGTAPASGGTGKIIAKGRHMAPVFSADGRWIAYKKKAEGHHDWEIWVMKADGSGKRRVVAGGLNDDVSWHPNGRLTYFEMDMSGGPNSGARYVTIKRDGTGRKVLFNNETMNVSRVRWSPDGKRLALTFSPKGDGYYGLYIARPDGSGKRRVSKAGHNASSIDWSPNGKALVYGESYNSIWRVNADATGAKRLAAGSPEKQFNNPVWSPNGKRIAYTYQTNTSQAVWTMAPGGAGKKRLIPNAGTPSWQPK
jgi:TolB protein